MVTSAPQLRAKSMRTSFATSATIGTAWTIPATWPTAGRLDRALWKAPAKRSSPTASKAAACAGAKTAPTLSATFALSTSASLASGNRSGKVTQTNHNRDAHTPRPPLSSAAKRPSCHATGEGDPGDCNASSRDGRGRAFRTPTAARPRQAARQSPANQSP